MYSAYCVYSWTVLRSQCIGRQYSCDMYSAYCVYSWTVLRSQCIAEESSVKNVETEIRNMPNTDQWCADADDWDVDAHDTLCIGDELISDQQELVDGSTPSKPIITPADIGHNDVSSSEVLPLQDGALAVSSDISSSGEPTELLQQLTINSDVEKPVVTQNGASTNVQQYSTSDVMSPPSNKLFESTLNTAAELEQYYIYVSDECSSADRLDHVADLLTRYTLQEGRSFRDELEAGNYTYVS